MQGDTRAALDVGLTRVSDLPVRGGYLDLAVQAARHSGMSGWVEGGWRFTERGALYGRGYLTPADYGLIAGVKLTW